MHRIITEDLMRKFKSSLLESEKSENTVRKYLRDVRRFSRFCAGEQIGKASALSYKAGLAKRYAAASANSMLASLNSFFRFAGWEDCVVRLFKVQKQVYCPEEKELTRNEYLRLCAAAERKGDERLSLMIQTICGTGIRVGELPFITVEAVGCSEATVRSKNKTRTVFIVRELRRKLLRYCRERGIGSGAVFVNGAGKPINRTTVWREMKQLCRFAGVEPSKVFPHNLRHLFARVFYGLEKDIAKLADILGHSSINTTRLYIISTGTEHRKRMENMRLIL